MKRTVVAHIDGAGTVTSPAARDDIRDTLRAFKGQCVDITIAPHRNRRSEQANAYLWGVVYRLMAEYTGHTEDEIHDAMCAVFLPNERKRLTFFHALMGEVLDVEIDTRRSSKLTGTAFYDFVEQVRQFARESLGVETPDPDPEYWRRERAA